MAATAQAQAEATKSAQRAGIVHSRGKTPDRYLGRKPSYDRAILDRVGAALSSASAPSLLTIGRTEILAKQTVYQSRQTPAGRRPALTAWGL
jgi:hypothetical protein